MASLGISDGYPHDADQPDADQPDTAGYHLQDEYGSISSLSDLSELEFTPASTRPQTPNLNITRPMTGHASPAPSRPGSPSKLSTSVSRSVSDSTVLLKLTVIGFNAKQTTSDLEHHTSI